MILMVWGDKKLVLNINSLITHINLLMSPINLVISYKKFMEIVIP